MTCPRHRSLCSMTRVQKSLTYRRDRAGSRRVDRSGQDEQDVTGLDPHRRLAVDLVLQGAFEDTLSVSGLTEVQKSLDSPRD